MLLPNRYEVVHRSLNNRDAIEILLCGLDPETGEEQVAFDQYCFIDYADEAADVFADALSCGELWRSSYSAQATYLHNIIVARRWS
jgi:hypothetical protein